MTSMQPQHGKGVSTKGSLPLLVPEKESTCTTSTVVTVLLPPVSSLWAVFLMAEYLSRYHVF